MTKAKASAVGKNPDINPSTKVSITPNQVVGVGGYDKKFLLPLLRKMVLIRRFEEKAAQMYGVRKIGGFCHLYNGQEAVAVGSIAALDLTTDYVLTAYRDHGHALACGMESRPIMAELFQFLAERKLWWMTPIIIVLLMLGAVIIFTSNAAVAPFIYTLF